MTEIVEPGPSRFVELLKLTLAAVPLISALLSIAGINATEADVSLWIQALIALAGAGTFTASYKAVRKYKAKAD